MSDPVGDVLRLKASAAKRGALVIWTVYDKPRDAPDGFIARMHIVGELGPFATDQTVKGELEEIRKVFWTAGLMKLTRSPEDERSIVESWV